MPSFVDVLHQVVAICLVVFGYLFAFVLACVFFVAVAQFMMKGPSAQFAGAASASILLGAMGLNISWVGTVAFRMKRFFGAALVLPLRKLNVLLGACVFSLVLSVLVFVSSQQVPTLFLGALGTAWGIALIRERRRVVRANAT